MRLRNKPWAKDFIAQHPHLLIPQPKEVMGSWNSIFKNDNPIHIEVGTGKGQFILGMAEQNPDINYIGVELAESVVVAALQKTIESALPNVRLLNVNAEELPDIFKSGEVDRVYLNFSDPWPKKRHEKRRLTYRTFLETYERILPKNGEIHFKTDNQGLFEYSLTSLSAYGMLLAYISLDLHKSDFEGNVMTEYEEKFSAKGQRIYRVEAKYQN
ncbi:tRNA (guanosine(46)-N7)-methyltransferase TrmB [Bacillus lacus]|uniref:tRNA (guanine-N(7)-)-methyltransferase n=1 Tax=Metabacillus lacus TaxID=1983721 RepID=A0A7X2IZK9_9BACI|nr:tRNA (guanosine(46)-N7)-methyltransferase TrmB [Metabacillus lacus]MRX72708.1 tRNA (guanosine(46)-N7)-methyltransferase TrmB [Metabacillus lacus]